MREDVHREDIELSRFFVTPENVGENRIVIDDRDDIKHMTKVLRLSEGDVIDISDSVEWEYAARITDMNGDVVETVILDKQRFAAEPDIRITLFQGIPKQSKMETVIQKTVELGVSEIVPVFTARTVVADRGNFSKKLQRWQRISDEAVKQCGRGVIPQVADAADMAGMLKRLGEFDLVLFPYENEKSVTIKDALREHVDDVSTIALIIGPEGGFSDDEADSIVGAGGISVSLGKTILRTETAGMAAIAMVMYEKEL